MKPKILLRAKAFTVFFVLTSFVAANDTLDANGLSGRVLLLTLIDGVVNKGGGQRDLDSINEKLLLWREVKKKLLERDVSDDLLGFLEKRPREFMNGLITIKDNDRYKVMDLMFQFFDDPFVFENDTETHPIVTSVVDGDIEFIRRIYRLTDSRLGDGYLIDGRVDGLSVAILVCEKSVVKDMLERKYGFEKEFWREIGYSPYEFASEKCSDEIRDLVADLDTGGSK